MIPITPEFIKKYVHKGHKHAGYEKTVELADKLRIHADGLFPEKLIGKRRPSESHAVFQYRKEIYEPKTLEPFSKIQSSLAKIRKSQDWAVQYKKDRPARIAEGETLEDYCEKNFPDYTSVTNWTFSVVLKKYLVDPNSLVLVMPINKPEATEYYKPFPFIFDSDRVMDFIPGQLAVILSDETTLGGNGKIFYFFNDAEIWQAKQVDIDGKYELTLILKHELGHLPLFRMRAVFDEDLHGDIIYKSRLAPCLPGWNEAVREYSDLQASVCKHMFPTLVIHTNQVCKTCGGTGKKMAKEGTEMVAMSCGTCKGSGSIPRSPYEDIEVKPQKANEIPLPSPIAYYLEKDTGIIKIQDERIDKHILNAYGAVNFDFLAVGLNQSGIAKELDRSELNAFIYDVAEDLVSIMDRTYLLIAQWRYGLVLSKEELKEILPHIPVPEKYDIISETYLADQVKAMKEAKANAFIINALEIEYTNKKFSTDTETRDLVKASLELDPMGGDSDDMKTIKAQNKWVSEEDVILSANIIPFIRRAVSETKDFMSLMYPQKMEILRKYAKELMKRLSKAEQIKLSLESGEEVAPDNLGKIPLALQQLALARERANSAGDTELSKSIGAKINELLGKVS